MNEQAINIYFAVVLIMKIINFGYSIGKHGEEKPTTKFNAIGELVAVGVFTWVAYSWTTLFK